eukprot:g8770.t1
MAGAGPYGIGCSEVLSVTNIRASASGSSSAEEKEHGQLPPDEVERLTRQIAENHARTEKRKRQWTRREAKRKRQQAEAEAAGLPFDQRMEIWKKEASFQAPLLRRKQEGAKTVEMDLLLRGHDKQLLVWVLGRMESQKSEGRHEFFEDEELADYCFTYDDEGRCLIVSPCRSVRFETVDQEIQLYANNASDRLHTILGAPLRDDRAHVFSWKMDAAGKALGVPWAMRDRLDRLVPAGFECPTKMESEHKRTLERTRTGARSGDQGGDGGPDDVEREAGAAGRSRRRDALQPLREDGSRARDLSSPIPEPAGPREAGLARAEQVERDELRRAWDFLEREELADRDPLSWPLDRLRRVIRVENAQLSTEKANQGGAGGGAGVGAGVRTGEAETGDVEDVEADKVAADEVEDVEAVDGRSDSDRCRSRSALKLKKASKSALVCRAPRESDLLAQLVGERFVANSCIPHQRDPGAVRDQRIRVPDARDSSLLWNAEHLFLEDFLAAVQLAIVNDYLSDLIFEMGSEEIGGRSDVGGLLYSECPEGLTHYIQFRQEVMKGKPPTTTNYDSPGEDGLPHISGDQQQQDQDLSTGFTAGTTDEQSESLSRDCGRAARLGYSTGATRASQGALGRERDRKCLFRDRRQLRSPGVGSASASASAATPSSASTRDSVLLTGVTLIVVTTFPVPVGLHRAELARQDEALALARTRPATPEFANHPARLLKTVKSVWRLVDLPEPAAALWEHAIQKLDRRGQCSKQEGSSTSTSCSASGGGGLGAGSYQSHNFCAVAAGASKGTFSILGMEVLAALVLEVVRRAVEDPLAQLPTPRGQDLPSNRTLLVHHLPWTNSKPSKRPNQPDRWVAGRHEFLTQIAAECSPVEGRAPPGAVAPRREPMGEMNFLSVPARRDLLERQRPEWKGEVHSISSQAFLRAVALRECRSLWRGTIRHIIKVKWVR